MKSTVELINNSVSRSAVIVLFLFDRLLAVKNNLMVFIKNKICSNNLLRFSAVL